MSEKLNTKEGSIVTRRGFIGTSSAALGAAAAAGTFGLNQGVFGAESSKLKIALVGCGGRGTGAATQALSTEGDIELVAMADAFRDRLDSSLNNIQERFENKVSVTEDTKFVGFEAYKQAISMADVVLLTTPPGFRPIHFEEAIRQGKHVFMEKPVATDAVGVQKVLAAAKAAKEKNLKVGVGLQRHHQKSYIETIKRLQDGAIGDITSMRCYWNGNGVWVRERRPGQTEMEYQMRNWYYFNWLCGDHITEQHIHNLDVINWVKNGFPVRAQGMGGRQVRTGIDNGEIYDHHFVEFEYADGSRLYSQCRHIPNCWNSVSEHCTGTKGSSNIGRGQIFADSGNWRHQPPEGTRDPNPYQQEHDDLFDAIRNDKPYNEAEYGAKSSMTSILGRLCTYTGQKIEWEDAINSPISIMPENFAWDAEPPTLPDADGRYKIPMPGQDLESRLLV